MNKNTEEQLLQKQDRLDKRAKALRDNLKRRKARSKEIKNADTSNKED